MTGHSTTDMDWRIRARIYQHMIEHTCAPTHLEIASVAGITPADAVESLRRLHKAHALFLEPDSDRIRMLNPFSAVPTPFRVETGGKAYFANCAWDMLAIPAMLRQDAKIQARFEFDRTPIEIAVVDGEPRGALDSVVNFSVPFRHWYDDLIHT